MCAARVFGDPRAGDTILSENVRRGRAAPRPGVVGARRDRGVVERGAFTQACAADATDGSMPTSMPT